MSVIDIIAINTARRKRIEYLVDQVISTAFAGNVKGALECIFNPEEDPEFPNNTEPLDLDLDASAEAITYEIEQRVFEFLLMGETDDTYIVDFVGAVLSRENGHRYWVEKD